MIKMVRKLRAAVTNKSCILTFLQIGVLAINEDIFVYFFPVLHNLFAV